MKTRGMADILGQGIKALDYIQSYLLSQEGLDTICDILERVNVMDEKDREMVEQAVDFVKYVSGKGQSRSLKHHDVEGKLKRSRTLGMYYWMKAELEHGRVLIQSEESETEAVGQ